MKSPSKYLLTQLSAPFVGLGFAGFILFLIAKLNLMTKADSEIKEIIFLSIVFLSIPFTMFLWGKVLALFGVLTWEQAKGYPWSKRLKHNTD
ncbi:MAG: hypothetical protein MI748_00450 [Opitutales bacterium]|nr:hypothetical protein [Opitutales bacterium]